jgi:hypothetical protein
MQGTTKKITAESIRARWLASAPALVATLTLSLGSSSTPLAATEAQAKTFKPGLAAGLAAAYVLGRKAGKEHTVVGR